MRGGAKFAEVVLRGARIGGTLDMTDASVSGTLNMDKLQVESSLFLRGNSTFAGICQRF
jgi:hypothetical protein